KHIKLLQLLEQQLNIEEENDNDDNNNNNDGDDDGQFDQMRSGGNDDSNKDSGNTKEYLLIKHVIHGGGSSLALKEAVHTINSTQNIVRRREGTKTESGDGVITTSKMRSANNDDGNKDEDVDAGPKEHQKVENVVAFVNH
ncbi:Kid domain containing protein, partial [Reticulomyxa filosa]